MSDNTLPASWATPDEAPETLRPFLVEHEGVHVLNVDVDSDPRVKALKNAKDRQQREAAEAKRTLDGYKAIGKSPTELTALLEEVEALRDKSGSEDEAIKTRIAGINSQWEGKLTAKEAEIAAVTAQLDHLLIHDAAIKAILAEGGEGVNVELLLPHVVHRSKVVVEGGTRRAVVVDEHGQPRVADVHGNPLEFAGLVKEMRKNPVYAPAFPSATPPGSGAQNTRGGSGRVSKRSDLKNDSERAAFISEHGLAAYQELAA